ncbi:hypothetical protein KIW84_062075 [Lathyrus oleraceus]|uniref:Uncharacterized protein n=1 Tax=Pisum sativum TaxID=3888 RepID=A0A9D4W5Y4_PEA|nr:hypothetical protein KIW84_062075 [Pisum sativum]
MLKLLKPIVDAFANSEPMPDEVPIKKFKEAWSCCTCIYHRHQVQHLKSGPKDTDMCMDMLQEEELLYALLWLYHFGLDPNFKQASIMTLQAQSISLLEETDKKIRDRACGEKLKHLKEARSRYGEEVIDCVRHCAWYRISLLSRWKQRGMYAMCMWVVQLLLVLSSMGSVFIYTPEYYLEALVDCLHVLRKIDPPLVPSTILIKHGLVSFVTDVALLIAMIQGHQVRILGIFFSSLYPPWCSTGSILQFLTASCNRPTQHSLQRLHVYMVKFQEDSITC